jgi:hypothetical protein
LDVSKHFGADFLVVGGGNREGFPVFGFLLGWETPVEGEIHPVAAGFVHHAWHAIYGMCFMMNLFVDRGVHEFEPVHTDRTWTGPQVHGAVKTRLQRWF